MEEEVKKETEVEVKHNIYHVHIQSIKKVGK